MVRKWEMVRFIDSKFAKNWGLTLWSILYGLNLKCTYHNYIILKIINGIIYIKLSVFYNYLKKHVMIFLILNLIIQNSLKL